MENATEALLMAFAVLIFVVALSVTFSSLAQAKSTADVVLYYSDRENFQTPIKDDKENIQNGGRTVGVDTVIATISRCVKEKFSVKIIGDKNSNTKEYIFEYDANIYKIKYPGITTTKEGIEKEYEEFLKNYNKDDKYIETYVETTISGETYVGEDVTTLEEDVGKKIYITYTKK